jgi:hypothetical protein
MSFIINGAESNYLELSKLDLFEDASEWLQRFCDTYSRLPTLLAVSDRIKKELFFSLLGDIWSDSDNVSKYKEVLKNKFIHAKRCHLDLMMNKSELIEFSQLPEILEIYRGCYPDNIDGFSWSLDKNIAKSFTEINRYKRDCWPPLLLRGYINKSKSIYKQTRNESEIIVLHEPVLIDLVT